MTQDNQSGVKPWEKYAALAIGLLTAFGAVTLYKKLDDAGKSPFPEKKAETTVSAKAAVPKS
jgi:hypothetical protein